MSFLNKGAVIGAISAALAVLSPHAALSEADITWRIQSNLSSEDPGYQILETHFLNRVEEMSGGRIEFQLQPVGALFPIAEGLDAVGAGLVEAATLVGGYYVGKLGPIAAIESGLPGAEHTPLERYNFFYGAGFIDLAREAYAPHNIHYLAPYLSASWDIMSNKPLRSAADFDGLKIRTFGIEAEWYKSMGAAPVFMGGGEIYTAMSTGVIDALRWGGPSVNLDRSFHEVAKYYVQPSPMPAPNNFIAINQAAWDTLPNDIKLMMETAAAAASFEYIARTEVANAAARKAMTEAGVEFTQIPADEWAEMETVVRGLWRAYAETDPGLAARGVEMMNNYLVSLGR